MDLPMSDVALSLFLLGSNRCSCRYCCGFGCSCLGCGGSICHIYPYVFDATFLAVPPTVTLRPRRVRAFVLVRWPRDGKFWLCRMPRYALMSFRRLMLPVTMRCNSP